MTIITLRCDMFKQGSGELMHPPNCIDGTCDGCNLHFLWLTSQACPSCGDDVYTEITGECVDGEQQIHYIAPKSVTTTPYFHPCVLSRLTVVCDQSLS